MSKRNTFRFSENSSPNSGEWTIYEKTGCPHCENSVKLLKDRNIPVKVLNQNQFENASSSFKEQVETKKHTTWPRVFNDKDVFIGGNGDLIELLK
jgi:glutaredoxin